MQTWDSPPVFLLQMLVMKLVYEILLEIVCVVLRRIFSLDTTLGFPSYVVSQTDTNHV